MSETLLPYPDHIYEQPRIDLAATLLEKETRKLLLGLPEDAWPAIDQSIRGWADDPTAYHLEKDPQRDFWDSFAAFMASIKLKPDITALITAENVQWRKESMAVHSIHMTSPQTLGQLQYVPGLEIRAGLPVAEYIDAMLARPDSIAMQRQMIDEHSTDPAQDSYPIIVQTAKAGSYDVVDGHRRTMQAAIYGQQEVTAWVGEVDGDNLVNYWVPVNDMFQLERIYEQASVHGDEQLQLDVARVLKSRFDVSQAAQIAYQNRIANQTPLAHQLFELILQMA